MKKISLGFILVLLMAVSAYAMTWHVSNQWNLRWDAVTQDSGGDTIAPENLEYSVVYALLDKANPIELWRGSETHTTITIDAQGQFLVGVIAHRMLAGEEMAKSETSWSDDLEVVGEGGIFGLMRFLPPKKAIGFGKE